MSAPYIIQRVGKLEHATSAETRHRGTSYFYISYALSLLATRKNACTLHPTYQDVRSHHQLAEISVLMKLLRLSGLLLTVKSNSEPNYPNFSVDNSAIRGGGGPVFNPDPSSFSNPQRSIFLSLTKISPVDPASQHLATSQAPWLRGNIGNFFSPQKSCI